MSQVVKIPSHASGIVTNEEEVRKWLYRYNKVKRNVPWKPKVPLDDIEVTRIRQVPTVSYCLRTMWESRRIFTVREPSPQLVFVTSAEEMSRKRNRSIWDHAIEKEPPKTFKNDTVQQEIPGEIRVVSCGDCSGSGKVLCSDCNGNGEEYCQRCCGEGRITDQYGNEDKCRLCLERGKLNCSSCYQGRVNCSECQGMTYIKETKWIEVKWKCEVTLPFISKDSSSQKWKAIKSADLKKAEERSTEVLFTMESVPQERKDIIVKGGGEFLNQITNTARKETQKDLNRQTSCSKVLRFRETLKVIPITEVTLEHEHAEEKYELFFVGNEAKVKWVGGFPEAFRESHKNCIKCIVM